MNSRLLTPATVRSSCSIAGYLNDSQVQYFLINKRKLYGCLTHAHWFRQIEQLDLSFTNESMIQTTDIEIIRIFIPHLAILDIDYNIPHIQ